jgi:hypothetical protein
MLNHIPDQKRNYYKPLRLIPLGSQADEKNTIIHVNEMK